MATLAQQKVTFRAHGKASIEAAPLPSLADLGEFEPGKSASLSAGCQPPRLPQRCCPVLHARGPARCSQLHGLCPLTIPSTCLSLSAPCAPPSRKLRVVQRPLPHSLLSPAGGGAEVRRSRAATLIKQHWKEHRQRQRQRRAIKEGFCKPYFRWAELGGRSHGAPVSCVVSAATPACIPAGCLRRLLHPLACVATEHASNWFTPIPLPSFLQGPAARLAGASQAAARAGGCRAGGARAAGAPEVSARRRVPSERPRARCPVWRGGYAL